MKEKLNEFVTIMRKKLNEFVTIMWNALCDFLIRLHMAEEIE